MTRRVIRALALVITVFLCATVAPAIDIYPGWTDDFSQYSGQWTGSDYWLADNSLYWDGGGHVIYDVQGGDPAAGGLGYAPFGTGNYAGPGPDHYSRDSVSFPSVSEGIATWTFDAALRAYDRGGEDQHRATISIRPDTGNRYIYILNNLSDGAGGYTTGFRYITPDGPVTVVRPGLEDTLLSNTLQFNLDNKTAHWTVSDAGSNVLDVTFDFMSAGRSAAIHQSPVADSADDNSFYSADGSDFHFTFVGESAISVTNLSTSGSADGDAQYSMVEIANLINGASQAVSAYDAASIVYDSQTHLSTLKIEAKSTGVNALTVDEGADALARGNWFSSDGSWGLSSFSGFEMESSTYRRYDPWPDTMPVGWNNVSFNWAIAGDLDADGDVDGVDFGIWQANYPTASGALSDGDADGDGDVDGADFGIWQANYPTSAGAGATAIPEPATVVVLCIGGAVLLVRRREA